MSLSNLSSEKIIEKLKTEKLNFSDTINQLVLMFTASGS